MQLKSAADLLEKRSTTRLYSGLAGSTTLLHVYWYYTTCQYKYARISI